MTETGVLNRDIAAELGKLGHEDILIISDAGLAVPGTTRVIDLSLKKDVPTVLQVLDELLVHFSVESIILADLTAQISPQRAQDIRNRFPEDVPVKMIPQADFRNELTRQAKLVIRTGDFTANSNIALVSAGGPRWYVECPG